jgi:ribosome recycling factor
MLYYTIFKYGDSNVNIDEHKEMLSLTQRNIFNEMESLKFRIQSLRGYIQNDFTKMLDDGMIDLDALQNSIEDMDNDFDNFIGDLNEYRQLIRSLIESHINLNKDRN